MTTTTMAKGKLTDGWRARVPSTLNKTETIMKDFKKQLIKLTLQAIIAALTALLTSLGVTACR